MPPRKKEETNTNPEEDGAPGMVSIDELYIQRTMIARLAKGVLPANNRVDKDALLAIQKSATVFVSQLASNANDRAVLAGKKTIQPHDVMEALKELEFDAFVPRCETELARFTALNNEKRNDYRHRVKDENKTSTPNDELGSELTNTMLSEEQDSIDQASRNAGDEADGSQSIANNSGKAKSRSTKGDQELDGQSSRSELPVSKKLKRNTGGAMEAENDTEMSKDDDATVSDDDNDDDDVEDDEDDAEETEDEAEQDEGDDADDREESLHARGATLMDDDVDNDTEEPNSENGDV